MDARQLKDKKICSIETVSKSDLVDIQTVKIDSALTDPERMFRYLEQIRNPYCFLCGDTPVGISFADEQQDLSIALIHYFCTLK